MTSNSDEFRFYGAEEGDIFVNEKGVIDFVVLEVNSLYLLENVEPIYRVKFIATNKIRTLTLTSIAGYCEIAKVKRMITPYDILEAQARDIIIEPGQLFHKNGERYCHIESEALLVYDDKNEYGSLTMRNFAFL